MDRRSIYVFRTTHMNNIPLHEAQASLADLVHNLAAGQRVTITENDRPVAWLIPAPIIRQRPPRPRPPVSPRQASTMGAW
jgi:prevent-host-death family protein